MIVGVYFYNSDDMMVRAFTDQDFEGVIECDGHWTATLKPGTKDFQELIDFAERELLEMDPQEIETVGLTSYDV